LRGGGRTPSDLNEVNSNKQQREVTFDAVVNLTCRRLDNANKKSSGRKYGKAAGKSVKSAMHREKRGTLYSGKGGKAGKVTSRKQAIAIGLSEARKKGAKVPRKSS
jgi:hypothetical protein